MRKRRWAEPARMGCERDILGRLINCHSPCYLLVNNLLLIPYLCLTITLIRSLVIMWFTIESLTPTESLSGILQDQVLYLEHS